MPNPFETDWTAYVRTKSGRLINTDITTISNNIGDATLEASSRFGSNDVTLYPKGYVQRATSSLSDVGDVVGGAASNEFGGAILFLLCVAFWPITLAILLIILIKAVWGRPWHTAIPTVIVSELPWCIKRPLRRRFKWLND
jgi:hypothetical protein